MFILDILGFYPLLGILIVASSYSEVLSPLS